MSDFPIYIINLDRSTQRLVRSMEQLECCQLEFKRISAVSSEDIIEETAVLCDHKLAIKRFQRRLTPGEIACSLSHRLALTEFVSSGHDYCLILEDDALLHISLSACVKAIVHRLVALFGDQWLVCSVCRRPKMAASHINDIEAEHWKGALWASHYQPMGAVGLVWSRGGAARMLEFSSRIYAPFDLMVRDLCATYGGGFAVTPPPIGIWDTDSDIDRVIHRRSFPLRYGRLASAICRHLQGIREKAAAYRRKWRFEWQRANRNLNVE